MPQDFKVKDLQLADFGNKEISLAETEMNITLFSP